MLETLYKYLYLALILIFSSIFFINFFYEKIQINNIFYFLFFILLLPFIDKIIDFLKQDFLKENKFFLNKKEIIKKFFILSIFTLFLSFFKISILSFLIWIFIIFSIIFSLDTRYSFLISLVLLIYTPFLIFFKNNQLAENFSIYAYYFLIIGILLEIFNNLIFKQKQENDK